MHLNAFWMSALPWVKVTAFTAVGVAVHNSDYEVTLKMLLIYLQND